MLTEKQGGTGPRIWGPPRRQTEKTKQNKKKLVLCPEKGRRGTTGAWERHSHWKNNNSSSQATLGEFGFAWEAWEAVRSACLA